MVRKRGGHNGIAAEFVRQLPKIISKFGALIAGTLKKK
jgi:hypothetical protein